MKLARYVSFIQSLIISNTCLLDLENDLFLEVHTKL